MNWYVAHVITGKEEDIRVRAREQGIKAVVPRRRLKEQKNGIWWEVQRIIFPGYVFVLTAGRMDTRTYYRVKLLPGVLKILGDETGPLPIYEEEVSHILRLTGNGDPLGLSEVFMLGKKVTVLSGPLQGLEGKIIKIDARRYRAKVELTLLGSPRIVELAVNVISKCSH